ncbi:MAG: glycosyltransferase family 2 protein [Sphingomonadales bacterium]|nr:glycosyltransferase family 2 protein [Sphingomonadales bacterium]
MKRIGQLRPHDASPTPADGAPRPWLSILLPVYNVAPYLDECLGSIMAQLDGRGDVEVIVLDDRSTDASLAVAERLADAHGGALTILQHDRNRGLSAARNSLLDASRGRYIWFVDSDDYLLPGAIAGLRKIVDRHAPSLIVFDYRKLPPFWKKGFPGLGGRPRRDIMALVRGVFTYRKMYSWLRVAQRELWGDDLRFPEGRTFEDQATTPDLLLRARSFYYAPRQWLHYRIRNDSIMGSVNRTRQRFDVAKHGDMTQAMTGFKHRLVERLGPIDAPTAFAMAHFFGREFVKLAERYRKAENRGDGPPLAFYRDRLQDASPLTFAELARAYRRRLRFHDSRALLRALARADDEAGDG